MIGHSPIDAIPKPDIIRTRLAELLREADLLRKQLRVSERVERERQRKPEVSRG